jgi:hypothetical protein
MAKSDDQVVDLKKLVAENLNGKRGFANTKKLRRLGIDGYSQWLEGEMAKKVAAKAARKSNNS